MPSDFSVVALIAAYNEADLIEPVVHDLIDQGVGVYLLDDGSTDATVALVEPLVGRGVIGIERLTDTIGCRNPNQYDWERILQRKAQLAQELEARWFIHHDADEFRESPWAHLSLRDAIEQVDRLGFNAIDFAGFDFWPVHDRFEPGDDVRAAFTFYAEQAPYDRPQIRAWQKTANLDLTTTAGHEARFPDRRVCPLRFILRHYPIRGQAHGERKIFQERKQRFLSEERARGWHVQYDEVKPGASLVRDPSTLTPYHPDLVRWQLLLRHRGVEELEVSVVAQQRELEAHAEALNSAQEQLESLCGQIAASSRQLDVQREELSRSNAELAAAAAALERTVRQVQEQQSDLAAHRAEIDRLGVAIRERDDDIERWRTSLQRRDDEINRWRAAVEDGRRRLEAYERSLSWRWTAPARAAFRLLRGPSAQ